MQKKLLNDLTRHLYRNYVITYTMRTKMKEINYNGYPSEEHYEKLKVPLVNFHLDAFYEEDNKSEKMHNLCLNFRNYNDEIDVALKHVTDPNLNQEIIDKDFDTLEFKVSFLTGRIWDTIKEIWGNDPTYLEDIQKAMKMALDGNNNALNNIDVDGSNDFIGITADFLKKTRYKDLYQSNKEIEYVCDVFNHDVAEERKRNERGAWKVRMIKFPDNVQRKK